MSLAKARLLPWYQETKSENPATDFIKMVKYRELKTIAFKGTGTLLWQTAKKTQKTNQQTKQCKRNIVSLGMEKTMREKYRSERVNLGRVRGTKS